ncbi:MAG TPA: 50S ribosomal protein L29 [Terriglobales bacterium]|jgi:large subunit ribosomal protein L29|nr:50S ribosomal protein L29 [Terriglobales bacterium]
MAKGLTADKVRNLTPEELRQQQRDLNDQLFRLKFQMKMGQTESLKKIRGLRREIARVKTIAREQELAGANGSKPVASEKPAAKAEAKPAKKAEKKTATGRK